MVVAATKVALALAVLVAKTVPAVVPHVENDAACVECAEATVVARDVDEDTCEVSEDDAVVECAAVVVRSTAARVADVDAATAEVLARVDVVEVLAVER